MAIKRQALFWGALFLSIVALVLHVRQLFAMAAVLALLPVLSASFGRRKLSSLTVTRRMPTTLTVGERASVTLTVTNESSLRRIFFTVTDQVAALLSPCGNTDQPVAMLDGGEETHLSYTIEPQVRGVYRPGPLVLAASDPLGLRHYRREFATTDELLVYPEVIRLPYLWPPAQGGHRPLKPRRRMKGQGDEFYGVRDYLPGDDPRHIDWKVSARRGKLVLVEYERSDSLTGTIVLDLSPRWQRGHAMRHTLEYAVTLAAALAEQARERGSTVGLIAKGKHDFSFASENTGNQSLQLLEALARVQADAPQSLLDVLSAHQLLLPRRGATLVLSPAPDNLDAPAVLQSLGQTVGWFILDANTFGPGPDVDYTPLLGQLEACRARVQIIRGDRPLRANWQGGTGYFAQG